VITEASSKWKSLEYTPNFPEKKRRKRRKKGEENEEEPEEKEKTEDGAGEKENKTEDKPTGK
jgi:hypothetical protein